MTDLSGRGLVAIQATWPTSTDQGCKRPMVVIRTDKPSPEVGWPEKQADFSNPNAMMKPDSQQTISAILEVSQGDKTEGGNVHASSGVLEDATEAGKEFEMTLEELGKEIAMFDVASISCGESLNPLGPPISGPSSSSPPPNPKSPLADITNLSPSLENPVPKSSPKWTRIKRQVGLTEESEALNVTLGKRTTHLPHSDAKPPKRRTTHVAAQKENLNSTAKAGSQPHREQ